MYRRDETGDGLQVDGFAPLGEAQGQHVCKPCISALGMADEEHVRGTQVCDKRPAV